MKIVFASVLAAGALASDNGRAITPPMGWRSWNLYGSNVDQTLIEGIMDGMVSKKRSVDGKPTSLCDLGYCDVGLDDNWQACGKGAGTNFHDSDGNPIVNTSRFPDMKKMTDHAHSLGLTAGWYGNNCICNERNTQDEKYYIGDVKALDAFGFDGVKLDGCGVQTDMELYYELMNKSGRAITVENCHWGSKIPFEPNATWCPWNFFRTSGDVRAQYSSVLRNLATTYKYAEGLSRPGCWAYPDMLEVGCQRGPGGAGDPGLTPEETRSHFGAWVIVSSPLTLSHDVNNDTVMDEVWPLIANPELIAVNQAWFGHSGGPFSFSEEKVTQNPINYSEDPKLSEEKRNELMQEAPLVTSAVQMLYKKIDASHTAVLLMNTDTRPTDITLKFSDVPGLTGNSVDVRDLFARKDLGGFQTSYTAKAVAGHDVSFLMLKF